MKLYSIWDKSQQRFFVGDDWSGKQNWHRTPRYWQTIDGIRKNLIRIGSQYRGETTGVGVLADETLYGFKRYADFDLNKLESIEVIVTDVAVLGEERLIASDLFSEVTQ